MSKKYHSGKIYEIFNDDSEVEFNGVSMSRYEYEIKNTSSYIIEDIDRRHELVKVFFTKKNASTEMNLGQYLIYLIILEPFYIYDEEINEEVLPDVSNINEIEKYFDWCIDHFGIELDNDNIGEVLVEIIDNLNEVSCDATKEFGPTFDLHSFITLADRNEEFAKILYEPDSFIKETNGEVTPEMIVEHTHEIVDKLQDIIINDEENTFKHFITSGAGINSKQLGQVLGYIGLKPDLKEKIIPKSIDTNFCIGLRNITDFYINAVGCLKALITVKIQTKNSGYLTRKLQILLEDEYIADVEDCGTKHLLPFTIKSNKNLKHMNNLYYSLHENGKNLKKISLKDPKAKELIGKTVYLRSPITCACKTGICKKCYGELYKVNKDMNIGLIASLIITNMITQTNLSVKHLLQAVVLTMLNQDVLKYFTVEIDKLSIKDEYMDKISLAFNKDTIEDSEGEELSTSTITVIDDDTIIDIDNNIIFDINPEIIETISSKLDKDTDKYIVKAEKLKNFDYIFSYSVENNSLSGPMLKLKEIIEKNEFIKSHNVFELFNKIVEILTESNSKTDYVHIGVLIKNLMQYVDREDLKVEGDFPEYTLYSVPDAIHYTSKSISKPLLFERIKDQLLIDKYGTLNKNGYSNYDVLLK